MTAIETVEAAGAGTLPISNYWKARLLTAAQLVTEGHPHAKYETQDMSGNCSWNVPGEILLRLVRPLEIG